jgi:hypothetical protein
MIMGKNIRRGHKSNVRCASCSQITRRDRAVYLFKNGIKAYYCPDCAKKIHGSRLFKGMPKQIRHVATLKVKRKFMIYQTAPIAPETVNEVPVQETKLEAVTPPEPSNEQEVKEDSAKKQVEEAKQ